MSKPLLGLIAGAILGMLDGASAWFTPAVRPVILSIVIASTIKGLLTGLFAGWIARKTNSMPLAIVSGLALGLALSYLAAATSPGHYYFEIMLPGCILGGIAGFASQRLGTPRTSAAAMAMIAIVIFAMPMHASTRSVVADKVIDAPVADVFAMWTTSAGLAKFFAPVSHVEPRVGGEYTVVFYPDIDAEGTTYGTKGAHVLAIEPNRRIVFEWHTFVTKALANHSTPPVVSPEERNETPLPTSVEIVFEPRGEHQTAIHLSHNGFRSGAKWDESYKYFQWAWPYVLDSLAKSVAAKR